MFTIKNLRREKIDGWTRLVVDFDVTEGERPFGCQDTLWFAIENKNADMLADDVYDAFAPFVLYLGMAYRQDVHIEGEMSPLLYHNLMHYVMAIFDNFSDLTQRINFSVEGFKEARKSKTQLVGTGFSCGVDSLNTLYSNFIEEKDERFKVNSLFFFNCGQHGRYDGGETRTLWKNRIEIHRKAHERLGLPAYYIDSNLHAFYTYTPKLPFEHVIYLGVLGCVLSVQRSVRRYLVANSVSYDELLEYGKSYRDVALASYSDSYLFNLFSTEGLEMVIDGCEYTRAEKLERIVDWDIARSDLDVCIALLEDGRNCSKCVKCMRTLLEIEAMGKLDNFRDVFDLETYRKSKRVGLAEHVVDGKGQNQAVIKYMREKGMPVPSKTLAHLEFSIFKTNQKINHVLNKIKSLTGGGIDKQ